MMNGFRLSPAIGLAFPEHNMIIKEQKILNMSFSDIKYTTTILYS